MEIIEAGHYYQASGPTELSKIGWQIAGQMLGGANTKSMLFIDDVHGLDKAYPQEGAAIALNDWVYDPAPDFTVMESAVTGHAEQILKALTSETLAKKKRAEFRNSRWYFQGKPVTTNGGYPLCVLLDAGLTLMKHQLGASSCTNILPAFYADEQIDLGRIVERSFPILGINHLNLQATLFKNAAELTSLQLANLHL